MARADPAPAPTAPPQGDAARAQPPRATERSTIVATSPAAVATAAAAATAATAAGGESPAASRVTASATLPSAPTGAARVLSFQKWTLNSGGCGAGPVTVIGTARFSIEKTSDAIVVTEEFRGSGGGFEVVVSGQVEFSREQTSYDIPTAGQWTGSAKTFKTTGTDRVTTSDGVTPKGASVVKFASLCG